MTKKASHTILLYEKNVYQTIPYYSLEEKKLYENTINSIFSTNRIV